MDVQQWYTKWNERMCINIDPAWAWLSVNVYIFLQLIRVVADANYPEIFIVAPQFLHPKV